MCARRILPLAALLLHALGGTAQETAAPDSSEADTYALVLYGGGGLTYNPRTVGTPSHLDTRTTVLGPSGMVRLLWLPDHRLRVGIESGWTTVYSYAIDGPGPTGKVNLIAVPLLLVWGMPVTERFSVFAGYGAYRLTSRLDYLGTGVATTYSLGYAAAASYVHPLGKSLGVNVEVEWYNAAETRHAMLAVRLGLVWKLYRW